VIRTPFGLNSQLPARPWPRTLLTLVPWRHDSATNPQPYHGAQQKSKCADSYSTSPTRSASATSPAFPPAPPPQRLPTPQVPSVSKPKSARIKFTPEDDLIIPKEVVVSHAHVAGFGTVQKRFAAAAEKTNDNPTFRGAVNARPCRAPLTGLPGWQYL